MPLPEQKKKRTCWGRRRCGPRWERGAQRDGDEPGESLAPALSVQPHVGPSSSSLRKCQKHSVVQQSGLLINCRGNTTQVGLLSSKRASGGMGAQHTHTHTHTHTHQHQYVRKILWKKIIYYSQLAQLYFVPSRLSDCFKR